MKCVFIYNPQSGRGKVTHALYGIRQRLEQVYAEVEFLPIGQSNDLESLVRVAIEDCDCLLFAGGDGTFHGVLRALAEVEHPPVLGYIPTGTVNDVARSLRIPRSINGALRVVLDGRAEELDCLKVNDSYSIYCVAAGAFTQMSYATPQIQKKFFGRIAYWFFGIKRGLHFQVFPIKAVAADKTVETSSVMVLVMNGKSVAGMPVNRTDSMTDGTMEIAIVKQIENPNFWQRLGAFFSVAHLFLFGYSAKIPQIECMSCQKVEIETGEDVVWSFDGERGYSGNLTIAVLPKRVKLFVPKKLKNI